MWPVILLPSHCAVVTTVYVLGIGPATPIPLRSRAPPHPKSPPEAPDTSEERIALSRTRTACRQLCPNADCWCTRQPVALPGPHQAPHAVIGAGGASHSPKGSDRP